MLRKTITAFAAVVVALSLATGFGAPALGKDVNHPSATYSVRDGEIRDAQGRIAYFRGVNVSGNAKVASDHLPFQPEETIWWENLKSWGFNLVRFTVFWEAVEPEEGRYDAGYLFKVKRLLEEAARRGIYVIVDMHQDLFSRWLNGDGAPKWVVEKCGVNPDNNDSFGGQFWGLANALSNDVKKSFVSFWGNEELKQSYKNAFLEVAKRLRDNDHILGYDIYNEPQAIGISNVGGQFENGILKPFYEETILALRSVDPGAIGFVEPVATEMYWSQLTPFSVDNLVYADHIYDSIANTFKVLILPPGFLLSILHNSEKNKARELGMPLLVGEFGAPWNMCPPSGHDKILNDMYSIFESGFTSSALWDYSVRDVDAWNTEDYSLIDKNGQPRGLEIASRPYVRLLNGNPVTQVFNGSTKRYEIQFDGEAAHRATVIFVPASIQYPGGFKISVSDGYWNWRPSKNELSYFPGRTGRHQVIINKR